MKNKFLRANSAGFTLVELAAAIGIIAILLGLSAISLGNVQQKASINTTVDTIISDMKAQQIKAMIGDTGGGATANSYGVHFDANQYVLFNGSTYSSAELSNFPVSLPPTLQFTTLIDVVFSQISGELVAPALIIIRNITNSEEKTIQLNKYGVVTGVN